MNQIPLLERINQIVEQGIDLKNKYLQEENATIDYVAMFTQNSEEYDFYNQELNTIASIVNENTTGITYRLNVALATNAGELYLIKVRKPDQNKAQLGAPDFKIDNYDNLKEKYLKNPQFGITKASDGTEMVELKDENFNVLVYFPQLTLGEELLQAEAIESSPSEDTEVVESSSLEQQLEEERTKRLQLMADFQNYKKRMDTERATFGAIANVGLIQELLEVYDDLELALQDTELSLDHAKSAMKNAQEKLSVASRNAGVEQVSVKIGDEFDKTKMEAIQAIANEEMKNKVIAVISSAYKYVGQENILKPAKVIVGK